MRIFALLLALTFGAAAQAQTPPSPTVNNITVQGKITATALGASQPLCTDTQRALTTSGCGATGAGLGANTFTGIQTAPSFVSSTNGLMTGLNVINVVDQLGLKCDNSTDNASVLATLHTKTNNHPGFFVYFPPQANNCLTSADLIFDTGTTYWAAPHTVTFKPTVGSIANPLLAVFTNFGTNTYVYGLTFDGNLAATQFTASASGTTLTVSALGAGSAPLYAGAIQGGGIPIGTTITFAGGSGGTGTYTLSANVGTVSSEAMSQAITNSSTVVQLFNATNAVLDNITVQNTRGIAALFSYSTGLNNTGVINSHFNNIGNYWRYTNISTDRQQAALFTGPGTPINSYGNFVKDSWFNDIGLDAIQGAHVLDFAATGNHCFEPSIQPLTLVGATAYNACVFISTANYATVTNNTSVNMSGNSYDINAGIASMGLGDIVSNNIALNSGQACIAMNTLSNVVVTGNQCTNMDLIGAGSEQRAGIFLSGLMPNPTLSNNQITDTQLTPTTAYGIQYGTIPGSPPIGGAPVVTGAQISLSNIISNVTISPFTGGAGYTNPPPAISAICPIDSTAGTCTSLALGTSALGGQTLSAAYGNTAYGFNALGNTLTTGAVSNTAIGYKAGLGVTSATGNVFVGTNAESTINASRSVVIGANATGFGSQSTVLGNGTVAAANGVTIGFTAGAHITSGGTSNTVIGTQAASTTLVSGTGNIVIGTSSAVDTPTASTSNYVNIGTGIEGYIGAPTIASGFAGTQGAPVGNSTFQFHITIGTTPGSTGTLTMPTAPTGWDCTANDITTTSTAVSQTKQTGGSATTVILTNFNDVSVATAWIAADVLNVKCLAY